MSNRLLSGLRHEHDVVARRRARQIAEALGFQATENSTHCHGRF